METVDVEPVFLMYAFRYALGRQSYAVKDVAHALALHRDALRADWREQIVRDIEEAIAQRRAGAANDVEVWRAVAEMMKEAR
jgi:hypothetical protein